MLELIKTAYLKASIAVSNLNAPTKFLIGLGAFLCCSTEAAAADSWWDQINNFTQGLSSTQTGFINAARVGGVVICIIGLWMLYSKNQRHNQDIKGSHIIIALLVGGLLVALPSFITSTSNTAGVQGSSVS